MSDFQDWTPVQFRKSKDKGTAHGVKTVIDPESVKKAKLDQDDEYSIPKVKSETAKMILNKRLEKKLTQDQAAKLCQIQLSVYKSYEAGTAIMDTKIMRKIQKGLQL